MYWTQFTQVDLRLLGGHPHSEYDIYRMPQLTTIYATKYMFLHSTYFKYLDFPYALLHIMVTWNCYERKPSFGIMTVSDIANFETVDLLYTNGDMSTCILAWYLQPVTRHHFALTADIVTQAALVTVEVERQRYCHNQNHNQNHNPIIEAIFGDSYTRRAPWQTYGKSTISNSVETWMIISYLLYCWHTLVSAVL